MAAAARKLEVFALGRAPWRTQDPFLFCAYHLDKYPAGDASMGPSQETFARRNIGSDFSYVDGWSMYHGSTVPGFPAHPHRGFETVTVVRQGQIDHFDSLGMGGSYSAGDVQWMTAGRGIQHSEMFPLRNQSGPNPTELFQLWLNLPRRSKMVPPSALMLWNEEVPVARVGSSTVRVIAGAMEGVKAPAPPRDSYAAAEEAAVGIFEMHVAAGGALTLPARAAGVLRTVYVFRGDATVGGAAVGAMSGAIVDATATVAVASSDGADVLVLEGRPIGEPVAQHGPFVMNTAGEIAQAFADYRETQFGGWPWDRADPAHPRDAPRHVRHADGRMELPPGKA